MTTPSQDLLRRCFLLTRNLELASNAKRLILMAGSILYQSTFILLACSAPDVDALLTRLSDPDSHVQYDAAQALGLVDWSQHPAQREPAISALVQQLAAPYPSLPLIGEFSDVGGMAVWSLYQIGDPAIPAVIDALNHEHPNVRSRAAELVAQFGSRAQSAEARLRELISRNDEDRSKALHALASLELSPEKVFPILAELAQDPDKWKAIAGISEMYLADPTGELALPVLLRAIQDVDGNVAAAALEQLGKYRDKAEDAIPLLVKLLDSESEYTAQIGCMIDSLPIRHLAAETLINIGPHPRIPMTKFYRLMFTDEDLQLKAAGIVLLNAPESHKFKRRAFQILAKADAFHLMAKSKSDEVLQHLIQVIRTPDETEYQDRHSEALWALATFGPDAVPALPTLQKMISEADEFIMDDIVDAMIAIGQPAQTLIPDLEKRLPSLEYQDDEVRRAIIELKRISS